MSRYEQQKAIKSLRVGMNSETVIEKMGKIMPPEKMKSMLFKDSNAEIVDYFVLNYQSAKSLGFKAVEYYLCFKNNILIEMGEEDCEALLAGKFNSDKKSPTVAKKAKLKKQIIPEETIKGRCRL